MKICIDKTLPAHRLSEAGSRAMREASRNLPDPVLLGNLATQDIRREALVSLVGKRWQTGRTIRWHFLDGPDWARDSAFRYASYWLNQANLRFTRTRDRMSADIRVSFDPAHGGSWSYLGVDALLIPEDEPTLVLGWFLEGGQDHGDKEERRRVALHETGHMLSFGHEQSHPEGGIPWDKERVYDWYGRSQGWSREEIDQQVFFRYSVGATNFSAYDRASIMHYSIPPEFVTDPAYAVGWNAARSRTDKRYAGLWYGKNPAASALGTLRGLITA